MGGVVPGKLTMNLYILSPQNSMYNVKFSILYFYISMGSTVFHHDERGLYNNDGAYNPTCRSHVILTLNYTFDLFEDNNHHLVFHWSLRQNAGHAGEAADH